MGVAVVEEGPVRSTIRSTWSLAHSTVVQEVSLYQGRPFVELRLTIDWHESGQLMKVVVPTTIVDPSSAAGAPYGFVERPCSGHEEPMVHWIDLSDGRRGVAVTSDGAGGYDAARRTPAAHGPAESQGCRPRLGLGQRRSDCLSGHRPGAPPVALPSHTAPRDVGRRRGRPDGRRATGGAARRPRYLAPWPPRARSQRHGCGGDGVVVPVVKRAEMEREPCCGCGRWPEGRAGPG